MFGATGQVARSVLAQAGAAGFSVNALSRNDVDLRDLAAVEAAVLQAPERAVVLNAAAFTGVDRAEDEIAACHTVNAAAPIAMANACRVRGATFLHISTDYVFDGVKSGEYFESDLPNPKNVYGAAKLAGEIGILAAHERSVILRTSWVYSRYGRNFLKTMMQLAGERTGISVVDDQRGCPTDAADVAAALLRVASALEPSDTRFGIYHFAGRGSASWADFAEHIFDVQAAMSGRRPDVKRVTTSSYPTRAERPMSTVLCSDKFTEDFGYTAPFWELSVKQVVTQLME